MMMPNHPRDDKKSLKDFLKAGQTLIIYAFHINSFIYSNFYCAPAIKAKKKRPCPLGDYI
jgi:hypothetical protein